MSFADSVSIKDSSRSRINLGLRPFGADTRVIDIAADLRSLNELFLKNSLYLDDSLQEVMNSYVKQLHVVAKAIDDYQEFRVEWYATAARPPTEIRKNLYREANTELEKMEMLRDQVKALIRSAIDA